MSNILINTSNYPTHGANCFISNQQFNHIIIRVNSLVNASINFGADPDLLNIWQNIIEEYGDGVDNRAYVVSTYKTNWSTIASWNGTFWSLYYFRFRDNPFD